MQRYRQKVQSAKGLDLLHEKKYEQEVWIPLVPHEVAVGDEINKDTSDEIIQSIFSMGIFEDIEVSIDNSDA